MGKTINGLRSHASFTRPYTENLWAKHINKKLLERVKELRPDVFLVIRGEELYQETLRVMMDTYHARTVSWWTEPRLEHKYYISSLPDFDFVFTFDKEHIAQMQGYGARSVHYLPLACDPMIHKKIDLTEEENKLYGHDISFCGAVNSARIEDFKAIKDLDFAIWGMHWRRIVKQGGLSKNFKGEVMGDEVAKVYSASKIGLNVHHPTTLTGANARTFEIPACGVMEMVDYKESIAELFRIGEEIICYKDRAELRKFAEYFLARPAEREEVARRGMERALKEHRFIDRMRAVLSAVG